MIPCRMASASAALFSTLEVMLMTLALPPPLELTVLAVETVLVAAEGQCPLYDEPSLLL